MWPCPGSLNLFAGGLRYYACKPDIKVIAPWREWDLLSRTKLIEYAEQNNIPVPAAKRGEPPYSMDANLLHISYEGYLPAPIPFQTIEALIRLDLTFPARGAAFLNGCQLAPYIL